MLWPKPSRAFRKLPLRLLGVQASQSTKTAIWSFRLVTKGVEIMKKSFKAITSLVLMLLVVMSMSVTAFAASPSITFEGFSKGFDFQPGSEYTETDLFNNFKNVMPGDTVTETITFTNSATDCDFVNLYMRAEAHDETDNPLTYSETFENTDGKDQANIPGQRDETVATMTDFLSKLSMKVWNGTELIYDASPDQLDGLKSNKLLGTFRTGETATLKVELAVPADLGNEYANRVGEVDWIFHVEAYQESQLTVRKIWSDGNSNHPNDSVTVTLLRDGKVEKSEVLNAKNGWTYTTSPATALAAKGASQKLAAAIERYIELQEGKEGVYETATELTTNISGNHVLYYGNKANILAKTYTFHVMINGQSTPVEVNLNSYNGYTEEYTNGPISQHSGGSTGK